MGSSVKTLEYRFVPATAGTRERVGLLLHGFGADGSDLEPLCREIDPAGELSWILPHAPISFADFGFPGGRAWFPSSLEELSQALFGGYFSNLKGLDPPGLGDGARLVRNTLRREAPEAELVALAGFSQGAMVATEALLAGLLQPQLLLLFSGSLIAAERWRRRTPPVFPRLVQTHGRQDAILPISGGEELYELLRGHGLTGEFLRFDGGHMIPPPASKAAAEALQEVVALGR